jgi:SH3-like domain-containing protein
MIRLFQLGSRHKLRSVAVALLLMLTFAAPSGQVVAQEEANGVRRTTGLPLPRFVSLKSNNVNVRRGPGQEYDLAFTFVRAGLPVEIIQEFDNWRKIRDSEGAEGWVFHSLLSGERTVLVAPWEAGAQQHSAYQKASGSAAVVAYLQPRVVANVEQCTGAWCLVSGDTFQGWLEQDKLWGVYPQEQFED